MVNMRNEMRCPHVASIPGLPWTTFCPDFWLELLSLDSRMWNLGLDSCSGFLGLESWVLSPGF